MADQNNPIFEFLNEIEKDSASKHVVKKTIRLNKEMSCIEFKEIRKKINMTQIKLAETLDISLRTIQSYEQGVNSISGLAAKVMRLMNTNEDFWKYLSSDLIDKPFEEEMEIVNVDIGDENNNLEISDKTERMGEELKVLTDYVNKHDDDIHLLKIQQNEIVETAVSKMEN